MSGFMRKPNSGMLGYLGGEGVNGGGGTGVVKQIVIMLNCLSDHYFPGSEVVSFSFVGCCCVLS